MRAPITAVLPMLALGLAVPGHAAECELESVVVDAEDAALDARLEVLDDLTQRAEGALACGPPADPVLLARFWNAHGVLLHTTGSAAASADRAFAAAGRSDPTVWNPDFGDVLRARAVEAHAIEQGNGTLKLEGLPDGGLGLVDGQPMAGPAQLATGWHVVQAGHDPDVMGFAKVVFLPLMATLEVEVDLPAPPVVAVPVPVPMPIAPAPEPVIEAPEPAPPVPLTRTHSPLRAPVLWTAVGAGVVSGVTAGLALSQDASMRSAEDVDALNAAFARQKAFAYTSYGTLGVAVTGAAVYLVLP